mgnify:CR=1 FL=1
MKDYRYKKLYWIEILKIFFLIFFNKNFDIIFKKFIMDPWLNWIERSATDGEILDSTSSGSAKKFYFLYYFFNFFYYFIRQIFYRSIKIIVYYNMRLFRKLCFNIYSYNIFFIFENKIKIFIWINEKILLIIKSNLWKKSLNITFLN